MNHNPKCPCCGFNRRDKRHLAQQKKCAEENRKLGPQEK